MQKSGRKDTPGKGNSEYPARGVCLDFSNNDEEAGVAKKEGAKSRSSK